MAEETDGCKEQIEGAGKQINRAVTLDVSVTERNPLGPNEKPISEASNCESTELVDYHAQHVFQESKSLVPTCEGNSHKQTFIAENDKLISKKNPMNSRLSTASPGNSVTRTMNDGDREENVYVVGVNFDKTEDRRNMNNQLCKSAGVAIEKLQKSCIQVEGKINSKHQMAPQETVEGQCQHVSDFIQADSSVQPNEKDILSVKKEASYKLPRESTIDSKCAGEIWQNEKKQIAVEKAILMDNCFENTKSLEAVISPKRELIDHSHDTLPDYVGGKSPTFDKFDQPGAKGRVLYGSYSEEQDMNKRYLDANVFVAGPTKEDPKKLSPVVLLDSIAGNKAVKLNDAEIISKTEGKDCEVGNVAITDSDKEGQDKLQNVGNNEIINIDDDNKKNTHKEHNPIQNGSVDLDVIGTFTSKEAFNGIQIRNSEGKTPIVAENLAGKVEKSETSKACANGEGGSSKSSIEDSDNSSDSEVEFTKRASNDPNFATVYSFLSLFGHLLNLPECSLDDLEQCLDNCNDLSLQQESHGLLGQLHLKLLRRLSRSCKSQFSSLSQVSNDRLVKYLIKFSKYVDLDMVWDLEKFGYHVLGSAERLILLKALCEIHFDENPRFKVHFTDEYIKSDNFEAMRLQPEGHDMQGNAIWCQQDKCAGFRVYSVEEDDDIGKSWKLLASTLNELDHLLENLKKKAEVNPKDVALSKRKERKERKLSLEKKDTHPRKGKGKLRKSRRKKKDASESESDEEDENPCAHCFSNKRPDMVLLCDKCDAAYHTLCLRPPLLTIPEGDWICPYCQQLELIDSLQSKYKAIAAKKKALARVSKRNVFDGVKLSNIVENDADSGRSGRRRSKIDYNFTNYNQLINDAISNESTRSNVVETADFYGRRLGRRRTHRNRLNNLDSDSGDSESSEYECSNSEIETEKKSSAQAKNLEPNGCRRSRRLKRKYGDEEGLESSESEEEHFVRRSTRRQKSSRKTYIDYESDDTPEEVILNKKMRKVDDSDEYVASGSEEDPEDVLLPRRSRRMISDGDDEEETPECDDDDEETDVDEDLCEDMEKNVVSDETEDEELVLSPSDENDDQDGEYVDTSTDEGDGVGDVGNSKKRKPVKEKQSSKRGGKDIRNIIKSMREEVKKPVKTDEEHCKMSAADDSVIDKEDRLPDIEKEVVVNESEKRSEESLGHVEGESVIEESKSEIPVNLSSVETGIEKEDRNRIVNVSSIGGNDDCETNSKDLSVIDLKVATQDNERPSEGKQTGLDVSEKESPVSKVDISNAFSSTKHDAPTETKDQLGSADARKEKDSADHTVPTIMPWRDKDLEESCEKMTNFVSKASSMSKPLSTYSQNASSSSVEYSPAATIALGSFNPILKYAGPQPPFHHQEASSSVQMQHQSEVLRPRPYPVDSMRRPYESYQQGPSASYPSAHNPYHIPRPMYENLLGHQALFPQRMRGFSRIAPPQYPGFSGSEQQTVWRQQRYSTPMQWGYPPYHNISNQGAINQQATQINRSYLDTQNANDSISVGKSQNHPSLHAQETSRRSKTRPSSVSDSRMPSASESYAAFRNMVIGPTEDGNQKRLKRKP